MSNPLPTEQQRRLDAWIAEKLFGFRWMQQTEPLAMKFLCPPERFSDYPHRYFPKPGDISIEFPDWDHMVPRFTDPSSPRQLLDEARTRCIEKVGENRWLGCLIATVEPDLSSSLDHSAHDLLYRWLAVTSASADQIVRAIVLALDGNLEEIVNGK
jgi:hypothetical protein